MEPRRATVRVLLAVVVSVLATIAAPAALRGAAADQHGWQPVVHAGDHAGAGGQARSTHHGRLGGGHPSIAGLRRLDPLRTPQRASGSAHHRSHTPA